MTALDALLPGPRQRPDAAPKTGASDASVREKAEADSPFGRELDRLERPQKRDGRADRTGPVAEATVEEDAPSPTGPEAVLDPQAAIRALFAATQSAGDSAAQTAQLPVAAGARASAQDGAGPASVSPPAASGPDLVTLAERAATRPQPAASIPGMPVERPKLAVLDQETHFAPVAPGRTEANLLPAGTKAAAAPAEGEAGSPLPLPSGSSPERPVSQSPSSLAGKAPDPASARGALPAKPVPARNGADRPAPAPTQPTTLSEEGDSKRPLVAATPPDQDAGGREKESPSGKTSETPVPQSASVATAGAATAPAGLPAATLRQLADAIAADAPAAAPPASGQTARLGQMPEGPLRLLTIRLEPGDLGTVQVRMRLQEGRLEVGLETGRHETAELLRRDGGALTDLLRGAGYQADLVAIRSSGADLPGAGQGNGQAPGQGSGQGTGQGSGQGSGQGASAQNQSQGQPARHQGALAEGGQGGGSNPGSSDRRGNPPSETARTREGGHEAYPVERDRRGLYL